MNKTTLFEKAMTHWRIVVSFVVVLVVVGVQAFLTMPRQEFPEFTIRQGLVVGVMPGASSSEVEEQLTKPVETYLFGFQEVNKKKTYSLTKDGQMVVFVELQEQVKGQAAPAFWAKLRHGLNELKAQKLPSQVLALIGNNDFGDTSALLLTISAPGRSARDLQKYVEVLETQLRRVDATSKLRRVGEQNETIRVTISRERLARYGIRPATVWASLQGYADTPLPVRLDSDVLEMPVHVKKVIRSEKELAEVIILSEPGNSSVRLGDIASITREYGHDDSYVRYNGKTALILSVEMQPGNDITQFGKDLDRGLAIARSQLPPNVEIARIADQPKVVAHSVNHFLRDFGLAIGSVILVTMLLLPIRVASVAAVTIPICVFITLGILNLLGVQLETVSLAGLIVVLGMVVDNAIVIIDDHLEKLDQGETAWNAAWKSAQELFVPVVSATLAIIMAYAPQAYLLTGQSQEFLTHLPVTIAVALVTSMAIAALLVPVMNSSFIRKGISRANNTGKKSGLERLQGWFDTALEAAFRHPWLTIGIGAGSIVGTFLLANSLPQQLFPKVERNQFAVEVYLPNGRSLEETDKVVREIESKLQVDKRVVNYTAFIGDSSPRFHTLYAPNMPGRNYAQLVVNTTTDDAVVEVLTDYEKRYRGAFPNAWVRWKQLDMTPGKAPIEIRLSGDDIESLKAMAKSIEAKARSIPGTTWVRNDFEEPMQTIRVVPNTEACSRLSISPATLRTSLAVGLQGLPVATIWEGDYPVRVLLKDDPQTIGSIEGLRQQYVSSLLLGATVPLEQIAKIEPMWDEGVIAHRNGVRTLTVRVDLAMGKLASPIQAQLDTFVKSLGATPGINVDYGGEKEGMGETMLPMARSLLVSVGIIYLILLCQFKRHRKVLLVMMTMPLSLFGAILGLRIAQYPFGLTSFVGVIGLMGIVVRNGIILVGYADELMHKHGLSAREAALAAGKRRMRPIYLTSMAAAIGVVPMILNRSTLWGPLGTVTCFGMLFAMVLTLFVLPVAYWLVTRREDTTPHSHGGGQVAVAVSALLLLLGSPSLAHAQEMSLSLSQARELALKNNSEITMADLEIEASEQSHKAAYTKYFPQVSASALGLVAYKPLVSIKTQGGDLPVYDGDAANRAAATQYAYLPSSSMDAGKNAATISLTAIQPVYAGGRIVNGNRLAALGVDIARDKSAMARRDALTQTDQKYWQIVVLVEKERTLRTYEALLAELEKQVTDAVRGGLNTPNDLLKVKLQREQAAVDRIKLESGILLATRDMRRHVGLPDNAEIRLTDVLPDAQDPTPMRRYADAAEQQRPELRLLRRAADAEQLQTSMKRGEMLPTASVGASVMRSHFQGTPDTSNAIVFGLVTVPISGIWENSHTVASQEQKTHIAERRLAETQRLIRLDVQKSWDELWAAWRTTLVTQSAIDQSEVNLNEETDKYKNGVSAFSDLLEAQVLRQQARERRIDTLGDYWIRRSLYLSAVGRMERAESTPRQAEGAPER